MKTKKQITQTKENQMETKITQNVKSAVNAYLLARTHAELQRERVDSLIKEILTTAKYYTDPKHMTRGRTQTMITDPKDTWLLSDKEHIDYLLDLKASLQKAGYTIKTYDQEHSYNCPALTAEDLQRETEGLLIDSAAEMLGENKDFRSKLLCAGLDKYHKFIDLVVRMVVNMPDFRNPLTV